MAYPARQVILGQYLGIGFLVGIGILGSLIALVIPSHIVGLLGIAPILIGIKHLVENRMKVKSPSMKSKHEKNKSHFSFLSVAAVTIANGGDNIGVYVPLFSKYTTVEQITVIVTIFIIMTAIWCAAAYYLVNHPLLASKIQRTGKLILPFVLIGLGMYILMDSFLFI
jgi:cadmium resistance protein CadD (predicted permease)